MYPLRIGSTIVSSESSPLFIAEMSGNHNQSLERALEIVDAAAESGADAIKIQTYTADTITIDKSDGEFFIADSNSLWKGQSLHQLYAAAYTPWEWHGPIMERAASRGLICFSSPFDHTAVDFLESLRCPAYKIASFENVDIPLIEKVAATAKPIIISTGLATLNEIAEAVEAVRRQSNQQLALLKCTSAYPAKPEDINLATLGAMQAAFKCIVGLSDHTLGHGVAVAAVALGARIVEKHFTLSRADGGVDSAFSMEPAEFAMMVREAKSAQLAIGEVKFEGSRAEQESRIYRRSLYVVQDVLKGDVFTAANVRSIRPGYGIAPKFYDIVLGKTASRDIRRGAPFEWEMIQ